MGELLDTCKNGIALASACAALLGGISVVAAEGYQHRLDIDVRIVEALQLAEGWLPGRPEPMTGCEIRWSLDSTDQSLAEVCGSHSQAIGNLALTARLGS